MNDTLPDCMMPDGGSACIAYHERCEQVLKLQRERDEAVEKIEHKLPDPYDERDVFCQCEPCVRRLYKERAAVIKEWNEAQHNCAVAIGQNERLLKVIEELQKKLVRALYENGKLNKVIKDALEGKDAPSLPV